MSEEELYDGTIRPPQIPDNWMGEPLPNGEGWRWYNPSNRGDSVRIFRADEPYVVVTVDGNLIGGDGQPTGERLAD